MTSSTDTLPEPIHGIVNINKPAGLTSRKTVDRVRRIAQMRKAGHAGTLDPDATGVLLVCLGNATKLFEPLQSGSKEYVGTIVLGTETDTQDAGGQVIKEQGASAVTQANIEQVFPLFVGEISQIPPMYSAVKHRGKRLYELARRGIQVPREPRFVFVEELEIQWIELPCIRFRVVCSKGTYVRTLAADIGTQLGCGAHLRDLVRTRSGAFELEDSVQIDSLDREAVLSRLHSVEAVCALLQSTDEQQ